MDDLMAIADKLLDMKPDPVPEFILHKEFKQLAPSSDVYQCLYQGVCNHPFVSFITESQNERGFWPPFHGNSEGTIRRCLSIGLDKDHPCLQKAAVYLMKVLGGAESWDQYEKQDHIRWWPDMFVPLASAAMLSLIDEHNDLVCTQRRNWAGFANAAFSSGEYDPDAERNAQYEFFGFQTKRAIPAFGYYNLILLGPRSCSLLTESVDQALADYLMNEAQQIYYVYNGKLGTFVPLDRLQRDSSDFCHWIRALGIVSRLRGWEKYRGKYVDFIMEQRNADGLWEFPKKYDLSHLQLSDSWRGKYNKVIDSSIMVLRFLKGTHLY